MPVLTAPDGRWGAPQGFPLTPPCPSVAASPSRRSSFGVSTALSVAAVRCLACLSGAAAEGTGGRRGAAEAVVGTAALGAEFWEGTADWGRGVRFAGANNPAPCGWGIFNFGTGSTLAAAAAGATGFRGTVPDSLGGLAAAAEASAPERGFPSCCGRPGLGTVEGLPAAWVGLPPQAAGDTGGVRRSRSSGTDGSGFGSAAAGLATAPCMWIVGVGAASVGTTL